jgi:hypothetical protein
MFRRLNINRLARFYLDDEDEMITDLASVRLKRKSSEPMTRIENM